VAVVEGASAGDKLVEVSEDYDLVVVGSLERVSVLEHVLGSVAEQVVSRARCNVLTFPAAGSD
jgi:nucleotide-binding universal stress UspA family protein